jgi:RND superfamily putative drug exporter
VTRLFALAASRRAKWVIVAIWLLAAVAAGPVQGRFQSGQKNDPSSFLPGGAESTRVAADLRRISGGEAVTPAVVVFHRAGGLQPSDRAVIDRDRDRLNRALPAGTVPSPPAVVSEDGTAALLSFGLRVAGQEKALNDDVGAIRRAVGAAPVGLEAKVTGPAGISYDAAKVFSGIDGTLLLVTASLVFVLLILIYRSPIFWVIPLLSVGLAEATVRGLGYLLEQLGVTINGQTGGILTVLVFGAGTDYALLLVARFREELRRHEDPHAAMREALRRAGPTIFASGSTVIAALLCLLVAEVNGSRGLGPVGAIGIAVAMLAALSLLPALLVIGGRRAFWPFIPRVGSHSADETHGIWRRVADRIDRRHRPIAVTTVIILLVLCAGLVDLNTNLTQGNAFRGSVQSQQGQRLLAAHFPAGAGAPADVVVSDQARLGAVRRALARAPEVSHLPGAVGPTRRDRAGATFTVVLAADPSSRQAFSDVESLRRVARAAGGPTTLIGGASAQELDLRTASSRDNRIILPLVLVVVLVILAILLRALVTPVLLVLTVVLSYAAALGAGSFLFAHAFHFPGEDPSLVLYGFIFLVALGVDYNIFLMARVREETIRRGTRQGVIRALAVTGAVITSAGIVLAGTFSALASLPLIVLTEVGFVIAFGVLLDTFLVRTVLVPALVIELGPRAWWPSQLDHHRQPTRGHAAAPAASPDVDQQHGQCA